MKKKTKIIFAALLAGFVCCWFLGIICLHFVRQAVIMPALNALDYPVHQLSLKENPISANALYLMGLGMKFPPKGMTASSAVPLFNNHRAESVSIFLGTGSTPAAVMIVSAYPDNVRVKTDITPPVNTILNAILFQENSIFKFIENMHYAKAAAFSWWNFIGDAKQVYMLYLKAVVTPQWYHAGRVYHIETPHLSGFLAEGKYGKDRDITQLTFSKNGTLYDIVILDRTGHDFKAFLSNIRAASLKEADQIIGEYSEPAFSRELILASRISNRITVNDLEELLNLIEQRKESGEKNIKDIARLRAELEYLKTTFSE